MQRTLTEEKAAWMQTLRALLLVTDAGQPAADSKSDMDHLETVISKLDDLLADCARQGVEIKADENDDFERAKRRLSAWKRRQSA
jgi:hypothetical protein